MHKILLACALAECAHPCFTMEGLKSRQEYQNIKGQPGKLCVYNKLLKSTIKNITADFHIIIERWEVAKNDSLNILLSEFNNNSLVVEGHLIELTYIQDFLINDLYKRKPGQPILAHSHNVNLAIKDKITANRLGNSSNNSDDSSLAALACNSEQSIVNSPNIQYHIIQVKQRMDAKANEIMEYCACLRLYLDSLAEAKRIVSPGDASGLQRIYNNKVENIKRKMEVMLTSYKVAIGKLHDKQIGKLSRQVYDFFYRANAIILKNEMALQEIQHYYKRAEKFSELYTISRQCVLEYIEHSEMAVGGLAAMLTRIYDNLIKFSISINDKTQVLPFDIREIEEFIKIKDELNNLLCRTRDSYDMCDTTT